MRSQMRLLLAVTSALLSFASTAVPAEGATYVVRPDGTGDFPNIQAAINTALPFDVIELADGTFSGTGNRDIRFMGKAITVRSQNGPDHCAIDAEGEMTNEHRVITFEGGEGPLSVLEGVTITGGWHSPGGVAIIGSSPTIRDCVITENGSGGWHGNGFGGGIGCYNGNPRFIACVISSNSALWGDGLLGAEGPSRDVFPGNADPRNLGGTGGGAIISYGAPSFVDCQFIRNGVSGPEGIGGQAYCYNTSATFERCTFTGSGYPSVLKGGGIYSMDSEIVLTDCTISDGVTRAYGYGGGIYAAGSPITLVRCLLLNNGAHLGGGGIFVEGPPPNITGCTFYGNSADGGAHLAVSGSSTCVVTNSIFAASPGWVPVSCEGGGSVLLQCCDVWGNAYGDYVSCIAGQQGVNGNFSEDPRFCNAQARDFTLRSDSPCSSQNSNCGQVGAFPVGCPGTAVDNELSSSGIAFRPIRPNPFNTHAVLSYSLPERARVRLAILNVAGQVVSVLVDGWMEPGFHNAVWDGRSDDGRKLPGGVNYGRLDAAGQRMVRSLVLTR